MSSTVTQSSTPCVFCNSVSHTTTNCNSNMNGRRDLLTETARTFMLDDTLLDFNSFPINELRFIASIYEDFQKIPNKYDMRKRRSRYFSEEYDVEYLYSPIPTTLTKTRIIRELVNRWTLYAKVRFNKNHNKPDDVDCPICIDCMSTYIWNPVKLNWSSVVSKQPLPGALFAGNIRTPCGHEFCGGCWELHLNANSKVEYHEQRFREEPTGRMILSCPMCRHKLYYIK